MEKIFLMKMVIHITYYLEKKEKELSYAKSTIMDVLNM